VSARSTGEVATTLRWASRHGVPVVPRGGGTGLAGGAAAVDGCVILSLARMNSIVELDPADELAVAEAGVINADLDRAAAAHGLMYPPDPSSLEISTIGGNLATNAGGLRCVKYGVTRDSVLGLEVVLPGGRILRTGRRTVKGVTGYDLTSLFVGSEGTLGVITAAVLKLVPRPRETAVALCAVESAEAALRLFSGFQAHDPGAVQAFEFMSGVGVGFVLKHIPGAMLPLGEPGQVTQLASGYVLVELATPRPEAGLRAVLEAVLEQALGDGIVLDAAIAESEAQRAAIWRLREEHSEAQKREGASVKNDVSVPVSQVPAFIRRATAACEALIPGVRAVPFGHLGDGNIHFNLEQPEGADPAWFLAQDHAIMDTVNEVVRALDGSFSAEHGIGRLKPYMMPDWRGGAELAIMRQIKLALDPLGIMNPGKVLP
jgi:glycolate oxidase subunit GlcD